MTAETTNPAPRSKKESASDLIYMLFEIAETFAAAIPKSKALAADARVFHAELVKALEKIQEIVALDKGIWLSPEEFKEYDETQRTLAQKELEWRAENDRRLATITLLRWLLYDNADATLRKALESFIDALGPEWENRPLPADPHRALRLVG